MDPTLTYGLAILQVAWINILLSGDNAIVIAMACRSLPENIRRTGIILGAGAAILLRIIFAFIVSWLLGIPYLQALGGVLLLWIAIGLARGNDDENHGVKAHESLWGAVGTIAVADAAMSLDNVLAISAIAKDDYMLFVIGIVLSIPLIVVGASLITSLLARFPILSWAGAALLGWVAGEMIAGDERAMGAIGLAGHGSFGYVFAAGGAILVVAAAWLLNQRAGRAA